MRGDEGRVECPGEELGLGDKQKSVESLERLDNQTVLDPRTTRLYSFLIHGRIRINSDPKPSRRLDLVRYLLPTPDEIRMLQEKESVEAVLGKRKGEEECSSKRGLLHLWRGGPS